VSKAGDERRDNANEDCHKEELGNVLGAPSVATVMPNQGRKQEAGHNCGESEYVHGYHAFSQMDRPLPDSAVRPPS
jgi:hypothetical protein